MPSVPSISFIVRYDLTSAPTLVLTDATTYPDGAIGIFTITQPDGYVRSGNFTTPDITSSGGTLSTPLRLSSTGEAQCGTYIIKYEIRTTDLVISTFIREFIFSYVPVSLSLKENFDLFTPSLSYSDVTAYGVNNYSNIAPTRAWTAVSTPTGTKTGNTSTISLQHNGKYYDAVYTISLASTLTYQHTTYAWLSVLETVSKTVVAEACTPEPLEDLIAMMETLRQNSINCAGDLPVFEKAQSLFSHLMDQVKMALLNNIAQDGIYDTYEDLMAILRNGQPCVHTNLPIDPYDLGDYAVSPFPIDLSYCTLIGDGANTSYTVNHKLNDGCVIVQVYENLTGAQVLCDVTISDNNNVVASFNAAPTTNQYKVVVYAGARGQIGPGVAAGGTTNQYLKKTSNTNYATAWDTLTSGDLSDFLITNPANKDILNYDLSTGLWKNTNIPTIYTGNGVLTGNRVVDGGGFSLTLNPTLYLGGTVTGISPRQLPIFDNATISYYPANAGIYYQNIETPTLTANIDRTGIRSQQLYKNIHPTFSLNTYGTYNVLDLSGTTLTTPIKGTGANFSVWRGNDSADTSTSSQNSMVGVESYLEVWYNSATPISVATASHFYGWSQLLKGTVTNKYGVQISDSIGRASVSQGATITNYYGFYSQPDIGWTSGGGGTITNHYGLYLNTVVRATGSITNRWGVYAPDAAMKHYFNGNVLLGSASDTALAKLQVTGAIQQTSVVSSLLKTTAAGVLVAATLGTDYSVLPTQVGNIGKFLTTDGSNLSWADVVTSNIYTANGTLTGDRTVNGGGFSLTLNPVVSFGNVITGTSAKTIPNSFSGGTTTRNAGILVSNELTTSSNYSAASYYSRTYGTNTASTFTLPLSIAAFDHDVYLRGLASGGTISSRNYIGQNRDDPSDVSTSSNNIFEGVGVYQTHWQSAGSTIYTGTIYAFNSQISIRTGTVGKSYGYRSFVDIGRFTSNVTLITDHYAFLSESTVGVSGGPSATITNYYGLYLAAPNVGTAGSITSRWGVYAPDSAMTHAFVGNVLIGTTAIPSPTYKLDVAGAANFSSDIKVNGLTVGKGASSIYANTALGENVLRAVTSGNFNTAVGRSNSYNITTGQYNTAFGNSTLFENISSDGNTAIGMQSLKSTTGQYNTALGMTAGANITTGQYNIIVGAYGFITGGITTGSYNTVIGSQISGLTSSLSNNIILADGQGNIRFRDDATSTILSRLAGTGTRMVVSDANGALSTQAIPSVSGYVPYTGATGNVDLGAFGITAASIIKIGGTSLQFLKADGSVDSSTYYLASNPSGFISGITSGNVTTALGYTPVPTSRTLTINGTTLDLSSDRSWTVSSSSAYSVTTVTTTYSETATTGTKIIKADTTGGAFIVSLPTAVGNTATIIIKKTGGSANLTIDGAGTETIDSGLTAIIRRVDESITLISDNANWLII